MPGRTKSTIPLASLKRGRPWFLRPKRNQIWENPEKSLDQQRTLGLSFRRELKLFIRTETFFLCIFLNKTFCSSFYNLVKRNFGCGFRSTKGKFIFTSPHSFLSLSILSLVRNYYVMCFLWLTKEYFFEQNTSFTMYFSISFIDSLTSSTRAHNYCL